MTELATTTYWQDEEPGTIPDYISLDRQGPGLMLAVAILFISISACFVMLAYMAPVGISPVMINFACVAMLVVLAIHLAVRKAGGGKIDPFTIDAIFVLGMLAYSFSIWIQCLLGLIPYEAVTGLAAYEYSTKGVMLCAAAMPAFLAGYLVRQMTLAAIPARPMDAQALWVAPRLGTVGFVVFVVAVLFRLFHIFVVVGVGAFFSGHYQTLGIEDTMGTRLYKMGEVFSYLGIIAMSIGYAVNRRKLAPKMFWPIYAGFVLLLLVDGERGGVFQSLLVLAVVRHQFIKRIKWWQLGVAMVALSIVFGAVRVARGMESRSISALVETITGGEGITIQDTFKETGGSFSALTRTMRRVPALEGHQYGKSMASGVISTVPFATGMAYRWLGGVDQAYYISPAYWLTYREAGASGPTSGLGFNSVADAYLNYGMVGVPIVFFLVGTLLRGVEYKSYAIPTLGRIMVLIVMVYSTFYWARASVDGWFRPIIWALAIVWVAKVLAGAPALQTPEALPELAES